MQSVRGKLLVASLTCFDKHSTDTEASPGAGSNIGRGRISGFYRDSFVSRSGTWMTRTPGAFIEADIVVLLI